MATTYELYNPETMGGKGRVQRWVLTDLDIPANGSEGDVCKALNIWGARRVTIVVQNTDGSLDADIESFISPLYEPNPTHDSKQWELKPYSDAQDHADVDHETVESWQIQGPYMSLKLRGESSGAAISSGVHGWVDLLF